MLVLSILAGLGLFFVGLKSLNHNLKKLAGRHVRRLALKVVGTPWACIFWGGVTGFATQSGRTTSFLLAGIIQGGVLSFPQALPLVLWSNFGCTLIVFAAVLPFDLMILAALGLFGIAFAFEYPPRGTLVTGALFGVALLLFGLGMISGSAKGLLSSPTVAPFIELINASLLIGFALGVVLTLIAQSHTAIVLMAIAMAHSGLLDPTQAAMVILGTHGGSAAITYMMSVQLRGEARQLVLAQVIYNLVGICLFGPLILLESSTPIPLVVAAIGSFGGAPGLQAALFAIILNTVTPLLLMLGRTQYQQIIERLFKVNEIDTLGQPKYLSNELGDNPETTLLLLEKEQHRLMERLPWYLDRLRPVEERTGGTGSNFTPQQLHEAFLSVHKEIEITTSSLLGQQLDPEMAEAILNTHNRQSLVATLEECLTALCDEFSPGSEPARGAPSALPLLNPITESLDAQILTALSAHDNNDRDELELLIELTADRGPTMGEIRRRYLSDSNIAPTAAQRIHILHITNTFERATWSIHRYAMLLLRTLENGDRPLLEEAKGGGTVSPQ